ncbi:MAG: ATP-binding protein [Anaerolineales bacterium]|jgi:signal transduction histidine kinase
MRIRLFLAFTTITIITVVILGVIIQTGTQTVITSFANQGGFIGADRIVEELGNYYRENGSWQGVGALVSLELPAEEHSPGQGMGMGMGQGAHGEGMGYMGGQGMVGSFTLADASGEVLLTNDPEMPQTLPPSILQNAIPVQVGGDPVGYLVPESSVLDLTGIISENLTAALTQSLLPTALITGGIALLLALIMAALLMQPVRQLTNAADQIAGGDLSQRVPVSGGKELEQLGRSFNQMAESLEQSLATRQAMTADIAHELRTPLSVQRANLEALQDGVYPLTLENLQPIIQQNNLLNQLVEDLRTLALTDTKSLTLNLESTEPVDFFENICETFKSKFEARHISLNFQAFGTSESIQIDRSRITQVVNNLLQNAFRHTPSGGQVEVDLSCNATALTLKIHDSGEGIPEEALPHIFERFYRADQSRARDKGGTGLGLTIARQLVEAHHGDLTAANHPDGGAVFTLKLPAGVAG